MRSLPHKVLRQLLRRVPPSHLRGNKGVSSSCISLCGFRSFGISCHLRPAVIQKISPFSSIRSSATRADTGTRSVSAAQSVTSLWLRSPSAPRMTASCVGSAAPERMLHAATAVINPYWRVRLITFTPMLCRGWPTDLLVLCD